ncbi:hypothetical protein LSCM1_06112 [Leishmania martiniquensis]|uniref:Uncharacterized protein n=1 Tax=Leishmania martiniquensis TaxID=1580590 RepID=A0A836HL93_9TRYP|nr:hypothetical protein LSCM1_06112 [Leishmania martiniquensis]
MGSSCTKTQAATNGEAHEGKENFQNEGEKAVHDTNVAAGSKCEQSDKGGEAEHTEAKDVQNAHGDHEESTEHAADDIKKEADATEDGQAQGADEGQKIAEDAENQMNGSG